MSRAPRQPETPADARTNTGERIVLGQDIGHRYASLAQAERYRNRFKEGRRRRTHEREAAALQSLLSALDGLNVVLDVGSGPGRFVPVFALHAARLVQADFSTHMLAVSKADFPLDTHRGGYTQADIRHLPFATGSADLVFCHRLLNHLPRPEDRSRALGELARVSRRYVVVSCLSSPSPLRLLHRAFIRLRGGNPKSWYVHVGDMLGDADKAGLKLFSQTAIRRFGKSAAFFTFVKGDPSSAACE